MNPQWILLASATVLWLPPGIAMAAGRVPRRLRARLEPVRARGWCHLVFFLIAPLNAIPRAVGAGPGTVLCCTTAGLLCALGSLFALHTVTRRAQEAGRSRPAGPVA